MTATHWNNMTVELDGVFGSDLDIVRIARVSTGQGNKSETADKRFIDYLMRHKHMSPFEMPVLRFKVTVPLFVARQMVRHRTHSMNEISARYVEIEEQYYQPTSFELMAPSDQHNKQAAGGMTDLEEAAWEASVLGADMRTANLNYQRALQAGVSRENARMVLPQGQLTTFFWQQNLRNLLHFLELRLDARAQSQTRWVAQRMASHVREHFPWTYDAWERHVLRAKHFSQEEWDLLRPLLNDEVTKIIIERSDLNESKKRELLNKL